MIIKDWKKDLLTIPNMLSLFRLLLIPVYVVIYLRATEPAHYYIAGGILAVSCMTDMIDGKIARHFNMISTVGKFLDPLADKVTQFTLILCLSIRYQYLPLWIVVGLFVLKESFQLIAGIITFRKGKMLTGALITGKISTTVLFISLILLVLMPGLNKTVICTIVIVDGIFLLISFADYIRTYYKKTSMIQELED